MENDWKEWRKQKRKLLITAREAIPQEVHQQWSQRISEFLKQDFSELNKLVLGIYWPFRNRELLLLIYKDLVEPFLH